MLHKKPQYNATNKLLDNICTKIDGKTLIIIRPIKVTHLPTLRNTKLNK